ncbi:PfkB family carbohydrate kinase [Candidatus Bathyarchaeota archaeon]|nr:PfkB family carbohydrate kinase [Candidatus Bathyarchaeota archaeon]
MFDIVSVGHFSIDSIFLPDRQTPFVVLGGSAAYVSLAARRLESRVAAISKVGGDFPEAYRWWLDQEGVNLSGLKKVETASTTRFELKYSTDLSERTLHLKSKAPSIDADDLPNPLKAFAIHVAPIAGEVTYEIVEKLKSHADVLSLDPQGLVRRFDESGNISLGSLADSRMLDLINVYKSSQSEIQAVTGQTDLVSAVESVHNHGVKIVIVTLGSKGALLSVEGTRYDVPACVPAKLVDPTGAGDAFISGFLSEYVNGENILRCACVGAAMASFVVEGIGPTFFGDKTQVYQRARELYEKGIKQ